MMEMRYGVAIIIKPKQCAFESTFSDAPVPRLVMKLITSNEQYSFMPGDHRPQGGRNKLHYELAVKG